MTYEEKEVGSSTFKAEERKVAFLSPSLIVDVENAGTGHFGGGIMEFKVSKTDTTINRLSCYIFMLKSLSLSKPTKYTMFTMFQYR